MLVTISIRIIIDFNVKVKPCWPVLYTEDERSSILDHSPLSSLAAME